MQPHTHSIKKALIFRNGVATLWSWAYNIYVYIHMYVSSQEVLMYHMN